MSIGVKQCHFGAMEPSITTFGRLIERFRKDPPKPREERFDSGSLDESSLWWKKDQDEQVFSLQALDHVSEGSALHPDAQSRTDLRLEELIQKYSQQQEVHKMAIVENDSILAADRGTVVARNFANGSQKFCEADIDALIFKYLVTLDATGNKASCEAARRNSQSVQLVSGNSTVVL